MTILITKEMKKYALIEDKERNHYIKNHFDIEHLSYTDRNIIGFLGKFACCKMFGDIKVEI